MHLGVLGVLTGTVGVLQSTGWYWRYYGVREEYCGVLLGTGMAEYYWVLAGYWVGEY